MGEAALSSSDPGIQRAWRKAKETGALDERPHPYFELNPFELLNLYLSLSLPPLGHAPIERLRTPRERRCLATLLVTRHSFLL